MYLANFVQNCKIYSKVLLVNEINGLTNSDKFACSYVLASFFWEKWYSLHHRQCNFISHITFHILQNMH